MPYTFLSIRGTQAVPWTRQALNTCQMATAKNGGRLVLMLGHYEGEVWLSGLIPRSLKGRDQTFPSSRQQCCPETYPVNSPVKELRKEELRKCFTLYSF